MRSEVCGRMLGVQYTYRIRSVLEGTYSYTLTHAYTFSHTHTRTYLSSSGVHLDDLKMQLAGHGDGGGVAITGQTHKATSLLPYAFYSILFNGAVWRRMEKN